MQDKTATGNETPSAPHLDELKELACGAGLAAVREAVSHASVKTLAAVVTGTSDAHNVLMLLAADVPPAPAARLIAEAKARMRTASFRARLSEKADGVLNCRDVATLLAVSPATVSVMRRRGDILAVPFGSAFRYPTAQFANGRPVAGLQQLLAALGDMQPWVKLQSLLMPLQGFAPAPTSMLELLRAGVPDEVLAKLCGLARSWAS